MVSDVRRKGRQGVCPRGAAARRISAVLQEERGKGLTDRNCQVVNNTCEYSGFYCY